MRSGQTLAIFRVAIFAFFVLAAGAVAAFERVPFSSALYEQAVAEGRPIVVNVHADWCSTCQAQDRVLEQLIDDPRFEDLLMLVVDYDTQKELMRRFRVPDRSILVAIRGGVEIGRLIYVTSFEGIEAFLLMAVE